MQPECKTYRILVDWTEGGAVELAGMVVVVIVAVEEEDWKVELQKFS